MTQWGGEVIGVTGSAGKTSTKDVIAAMLAVSMPVGKTIGNLNNHVGVPLSILRLPREARVAVLEMGMNHAGEIRDLCAIARPRIGVVTNVGHAHMEAFDSIEGVARGQARTDRISASRWRRGAERRRSAGQPVPRRASAAAPSLSGSIAGADVRAEQRADSTDQGVRFHGGRRAVSRARCSGRHSVLNILAGIAVASLYGIRPEQLTEVVERSRRRLHARRALRCTTAF